MSVLAYFFLPALVAFPLALILMFTWREPYNIILLRPFFKKDVSKSVKHLVRGGLAGFGFIYTLSDPHMQQKWYVKYPVLLGTLSFLQFRFRRLTRRKTVDKFVSAVNRRRLRIFNWAVSWSKVFPVTCVDKHWQYCVSKLLLSADIILIDLTGEKSNVIWEIQECEQLGLMDRVVFIQREEGPEYIPEVIFKGADSTSYGVIRYRQSEQLGVDEIMRAVALKLTNSDVRIKQAA